MSFLSPWRGRTWADRAEVLSRAPPEVGGRCVQTIHCEPTKRGDLVKVTFSLPAHNGNGRVALVGDFNGWRAGPNLFKRRGDVEVASVTLSAGRRYEFRYVDEKGTWFNDDAAHGYTPNEFGGENSVVDLRGPFEPADTDSNEPGT